MNKTKKLEKSKTIDFVEDLRTYSPKRNFYFCTIAKNCSTSIIKQLPTDFLSNQKPCKDAEVVIILRDPIDRWFSGTTEYFAYGPPPFEHILKKSSTKQMIRILNWHIKMPTLHPFDYHTELQSNVIAHVKQFTGNIHYYYYHYDVLDDIRNDFGILKSISRENTGADKNRLRYRKALNKWSEKNHKELYLKLEEFYKPDYDMINNLNFVNWNIATSSK